MTELEKLARVIVDNADPYYALYCIHDRKAAAALTEAGFDVYRPTYQRKVERGPASIYRPEPLLGRYVLARIPAEQFHQAITCEHVAYAVGSNGLPRQIPETVVAEIVALVASGDCDDKPPAKRARPRKRRGKCLADLKALIAEAETQPVAEAA